MKEIPKDKLKFYNEQHQSLRYLRSQLQTAIGDSEVNLSSLSQLEVEVVKEAFRTIAGQGNEVLITFNQDTYAQDLERMKAGEDKVYLLCDEAGNLQDMGPLLPFVSARKRREYEAFRSKYLSSD
jgi:hypothetical protein|tara:strand:+ start:283 stop:657 length:375 start_codon:yes stop_codon:yes gene_type:complete